MVQKYEDAIEHFRKSVSLDPTLPNAHLYLATAYAQTYVPGKDAPENRDRTESAIAEYETVLNRDPKNIDAIKGIAYLRLNLKQYEKALDYYQRAVDTDARDPANYYGVVYVDWTMAYVLRMELRSKSGLTPAVSAIDKPVCTMIRAMNWNFVEHGIEMLDKAVKLSPEYIDAMVYLNLLYRERADMRCDDPHASEADSKQADGWLDKAMAVKRSKDEGEKDVNNKK
jgi:tetratricopeptide (TPR) repeat protein